LDASQSFFSGHAASCAYSCTFIAWYLQKRLKTANIFVLPFIQSLLLALGYFGAISRVFDHRHHVVDVVAGGIVGVLTTAHVVSLHERLEKHFFYGNFLGFQFLVVLSPSRLRVSTFMG
jgi:membrane-associated phospholipid phosphatase